MLPKEQKRCLLHQLFVRDLEAVEGVFPVKDAGNVVDGHAVNIGLGSGVELCVKALRHFLHPGDGNIHGGDNGSGNV